jgi:hypothetical protein
MKANHNRKFCTNVLSLVVANISCLKNESKSQPIRIESNRIEVVANISCLKNESKSQLASGVVGSGSVMIRTPDHYLKD